MKPDTIENLTRTITVGELLSAYYEAALAELGDKEAAAHVSKELLALALKRNRQIG